MKKVKIGFNVTIIAPVECEKMSEQDTIWYLQSHLKGCLIRNFLTDNIEVTLKSIEK